MKRLFLTVLGLALFAQAFPTLTPGLAAAETKKKRLLAVTQSVGFRHGSVTRKDGQLSVAEVALQEIGAESGVFEVELSQEADKVITSEHLRGFDALFFYTTGNLPLSEEQKTALLDFVKSGKGFIGVHSATDTFPDFEGYVEMINGNFDGHPWGAGTTVTVSNHETNHPVVAMFANEFPFKDEIYQYKKYDREEVRVLLSLNMAKTEPKMPYHVPICWVRDYGRGRLFYTNLGHNEATWQNKLFRQHLLAGFKWVTRMTAGPSAPNLALQSVEQLRSFLLVVAPEIKKNPDELLAKALAAAREDSDLLSHLAEHIDEFKPLFSKKGSKERAEAMEEIFEEIE